MLGSEEAPSVKWSLGWQGANSETGPVQAGFFYLGDWSLLMKMIAGFVIGIICGLMVVFFVFRNTTPVAAANNNAVVYDSGSAAAAPADDGTTTTTDGTTSTTDDTTPTGMLPDVKKIYNNALGLPYRQVEGEITDPDIAKFFHAYMDATGLDKVGLNP